MRRLAGCWMLLVGASLYAQCAVPVNGPPASTALGSVLQSTPDSLAAGDPSFGVTGALHLFARSGIERNWVTTLTPDEGVASGASFGASVARFGNTFLVGAPTHAGPAGASPNHGAVYVSNVDGSSLAGPFAPPSSESGDLFGTSVALSGEFSVAGSPGAAGFSGSVSIFAADSTGFSWLETLTAADPQPWAQFGSAVSLLGDVLVVGAPGADSFEGAVYVFERTDSSWVQTAKLTALDAGPGDQVGLSLALRFGGTELEVLAGAPGFDTANSDDAGRVIVFRRSADSVWTQESLSHPLPEPDANFGKSLALEEDRLLVGSPGQNNYGGAGYVFTLNGVWSEESTVTSTAGDFSEGGDSVALSDGVAWLGARLALGGGEVQGFVVADQDCDGSGTFDRCDILQLIAQDLNMNGTPDECELFVRGDINGDGIVLVSDVVLYLESLFVPGSAPLGCRPAADVNEDAETNLGDVMRLLDSLFGTEAPPIPAPWPNCGIDPATPWPCEIPSTCP